MCCLLAVLNIPELQVKWLTVVNTDRLRGREMDHVGYSKLTGLRMLRSFVNNPAFHDITLKPHFSDICI